MSTSNVKPDRRREETARRKSIFGPPAFLSGMIAATLLLIGASFVFAGSPNAIFQVTSGDDVWDWAGARPAGDHLAMSGAASGTRNLSNAFATNSANAGRAHRARLERALGSLREPERLSAPGMAPSRSPRDRAHIVLIIDDAGLDPSMFDAFRALAGPVTFSFLPYAEGVEAMARKARAGGDGVMLHLPMEPRGRHDAGPNALTTRMSNTELKRALDWNLNRFSGYSGVNNHMGSRFTRHAKGMETVLRRLDQLGLFFLDSVTTGGSAATHIGRKLDVPVFQRDIFLDAEPGEGFIRAQLSRAEELARETGFAVVICHPRAETLAVLGPWLTTASARGFNLETVDFLRTLGDGSAGPQRIAQADRENFAGAGSP